MLEWMEKLSGDKVVAFHVSVGITTKDHGQMAYHPIGHVPFATHEGLRRALGRQITVGEKAIVVDKCRQEFIVERILGVLQDFRGPRCVINGNEEERISEWRSPMNYWRSDPFEWSGELGTMLRDPCVVGWENSQTEVLVENKCDIEV